jgi:hypothetical protein
MSGELEYFALISNTQVPIFNYLQTEAIHDSKMMRNGRQILEDTRETIKAHNQCKATQSASRQ